MKELLKAKSEFRKIGVTLLADKQKSGGGGSWRFAGEDNFIKTIQKPLTDCGLELFSTMSYSEQLGVDVIKSTLFHVDSGESISSTISMPTVTPKKDRNGNLMYLDAEIERGKQFGYWSRILGIRILGLSDVDPEDMNNRQEDLTKEPVDTIREMEEIKKFIDIDSVDSVGLAKSKVGSLYSQEVDAYKKAQLKEYGLELKGILDELNKSN